MVGLLRPPADVRFMWNIQVLTRVIKSSILEFIYRIIVALSGPADVRFIWNIQVLTRVIYHWDNLAWNIIL